MANSTQVYQGRSISLSDLDLIIIIGKAVDIIPEKFASLGRLKEYWHEQIKIFAPGCIELNLDFLIDSPEVLSELVLLLDEISSEFADFDGKIPSIILNRQMRPAHVEFKEYKTSAILDAIQKLYGLLKNKP